MNILKQSIRLIAKSLHILLPLTVLFGLLTAWAFNPFQAIIFLAKYPYTKLNGIGDTFTQLFGVLSWWKLLLAAIGTVLVNSLLFGMLEKKFKTNKFGLINPLKCINSSILAVLPLMLFIFLLYVVAYFVLGGLIGLVHYLTSGFSNMPGAVSIVIAILLVLIIFVVICYVLSLTLLFIPSYMIMGYPFTESLSFALRIQQAKSRAIFLSFLCLFVLLAGFSLLFDFLRVPSLIYTTINITVMTIFYCVFAMAAYYQITETSSYI